MNATKNSSAPSYDAFDVAPLLRFTSAEAPYLKMFPTPPASLPGFVTFCDPGWSILHLRDVVATKAPIFYPQSWYDNEPFAKLEEPPRYRQLRMGALDGSFSKTFAAQQALLPADEEISSARVVVMGMVIHFLATGERLFPDYLVRCVDNDLDRNRVIVGAFGSGGFDVNNDWDDYRVDRVGLASARKF